MVLRLFTLRKESIGKMCDVSRDCGCQVERKTSMSSNKICFQTYPVIASLSIRQSSSCALDIVTLNSIRFDWVTRSKAACRITVLVALKLTPRNHQLRQICERVYILSNHVQQCQSIGSEVRFFCHHQHLIEKLIYCRLKLSQSV